MIANKSTLISSIFSLGLVLSVSSGSAVAQIQEHMQLTNQTEEFQHIDQPLWIKGAVTIGGLGLIGLELWWFLLSNKRED